MSTILKALQKRYAEPDRNDSPEAILARNAAYREAMHGSRRPAGQRWAMGVAVAALALAAVCVAGFLVLWLTGGLGRGPDATQLASVPAPAPPAESAPVRPQPLLRPAVPPDLPPVEPTIPGLPVPSDVYVAGPQPSSRTDRLPVVPVPEATVLHPGPAPTTPAGDHPGQTAPANKARPTSRDPVENDLNESLHLTGILLDPKTPTALINDDIVRVGGVIEGAKILAIDNPSYVRVEYRGKQYRLELK